MPDQMTTALEGTSVDMSEGVNNMLNSSIENVDYPQQAKPWSISLIKVLAK